MKTLVNNIKPRYIILIILICIILYFLIDGAKEGFETKESFDDYPLPAIPVKSNSKYTAVMVEPRKHPALEFVINNFLDNLDEQWSMVIIHGNLNEKYIMDIITRLSDINKSRIQLVNIGVDNLTIAQYSEMFYNPLFYNYIPTETFLIFQTDSMILKENRSQIYDFINYDYVGAPWANNMGLLGKMGVGNGGLSLRKKSKMVKLLDFKNRARHKNVYGKYIAEDQFFCGYYTQKEVPLLKPTLQKATLFSMESIYSETPFGIHKPWLGINKNKFNQFLTKYPDVSKLLRLN